jgi:hypothetical protein
VVDVLAELAGLAMAADRDQAFTRGGAGPCGVVDHRRCVSGVGGNCGQPGVEAVEPGIEGREQVLPVHGVLSGRSVG